MIGRKLDAKKQQAFIEAYEKLPNSLGPHEAVVFTDGEHPTHVARGVYIIELLTGSANKQ